MIYCWHEAMSRNLYLTQSQISARLKRLINVVAFYIKFSYYNCDYSVLIAKFIIQRISFFKDSFLRKFSSFYLRGIFKPNLEFYIIFYSKFISCFSKYFSFSSIYYFFSLFFKCFESVTYKILSEIPRR